MEGKVTGTGSRLEQTAKEMRQREQLASFKDGQVLNIPIAKLRRDDNIRSTIMKNENYWQFVETIRAEGLLQMPIVTVRDGEFFLVAGHRRVEALLDIGVAEGEEEEQKVKCQYKFFEDDDLAAKLRAQLSENLNREPLAPLDVAEVYAKLLHNGMTIKELTKEFDRDGSYISKFVKLAGWPPEAKAIVREQERLGKPIPVKKLVAIAVKHKRTEQLLEALNQARNPKYRVASSQPIPRTPRAWQKKIAGYLEQAKFDESEKAFAEKILRELGLLQDGIPKQQTGHGQNQHTKNRKVANASS